LNLSEILPLYLVDRLYLSVLISYWRQMLHIFFVFRGRRKLIAIHGKFAKEFGKLARGIWKNSPWTVWSPAPLTASSVNQICPSVNSPDNRAYCHAELISPT